MQDVAGNVAALQALGRKPPDAAPVAGGVADREEDRLVLCARPRERLVAQGVPVDRVVGVPKEVRACLLGRLTTAGDKVRPCGSSRARARMPRTRRGASAVRACARASQSPGTTTESTSVANLRMCLRFPRASIVFVLDFSLRRSGRDTARAEARRCRCRSSVRRSSGSGSHTGPPGRSRADGRPC